MIGAMERERWAWVAIFVAGSVLGAFSHQLIDLIGEARTAGVYGLAGVGLGWCWYRLYPRPLLERILWAALLVLVVSVFAAVFGGELSHPTVRSVIGVGVLAGLVLTEVYGERKPWGHQKRTALTSRETMRELH